MPPAAAGSGAYRQARPPRQASACNSCQPLEPAGQGAIWGRCRQGGGALPRLPIAARRAQSRPGLPRACFARGLKAAMSNSLLLTLSAAAAGNQSPPWWSGIMPIVAMIAVFSCNVIGTLGRSQARWLGWRSSTICCHAVPRSTCWSSTGPPSLHRCLQAHTTEVGEPWSTEFSTSCELLCSIAAIGASTVLRTAILPAFLQVRGQFRERVTRVTRCVEPGRKQIFHSPGRGGT